MMSHSDGRLVQTVEIGLFDDGRGRRSGRRGGRERVGLSFLLLHVVDTHFVVVQTPRTRFGKVFSAESQIVPSVGFRSRIRFAGQNQALQCLFSFLSVYVLIKKRDTRLEINNKDRYRVDCIRWL